MKRHVRVHQMGKIDYIIRAIAVISPKAANRVGFFRLYKRRMNDRDPQLFAEKIILRMESREAKQLGKYADKWNVREYISETIGEQYLIPILAVYDTPEEICYEKIPEGAFIKLNHGAGFNIVYSKSNEAVIRKQIRKWFRTDYARKRQERQYEDIKRKIMIQENIASGEGILYDYNFYTFDGKVEFAQMRDNRKHKFEVGREYEELPYKLDFDLTSIQPQQPEYEEMVELAEKLAAPFDFVKVDFFCADHRVFFGELTFSPGAGIKRFTPYKYNKIFGDKVSQRITLQKDMTD